MTQGNESQDLNSESELEMHLLLFDRACTCEARTVRKRKKKLLQVEEHAEDCGYRKIVLLRAWRTLGVRVGPVNGEEQVRLMRKGLKHILTYIVEHHGYFGAPKGLLTLDTGAKQILAALDSLFGEAFGNPDFVPTESEVIKSANFGQWIIREVDNHGKAVRRDEP